ncbi:MAG TPA: histidine phosphatase family protein [Burkholderiaceae bacterium]
MDLILWRHADAGDNLGDPVADLERPLRPKGERQAQRVAAWLNQFLPDSARILSSPALRCTQTAAALGRRVKKVAALGPDGDVEGLLAAARWPDAREPVLVVGHQPTLGMVAAYLMAGEAARFGEPWSIKKGSVWWLRHRPRDDRAEVQIVAVRTAEGL